MHGVDSIVHGFNVRDRQALGTVSVPTGILFAEVPPRRWAGIAPDACPGRLYNETGAHPLAMPSPGRKMQWEIVELLVSV